MVGAALAALLLTSASAYSREKQPKKKKNQDLSANPLANVNSKQPDKELFDKAMTAMKKGKFDVARLDLQTMLNTYPDSEFRMRAKLALGDTWFKEGGTAALTQAEAEYKDFITFFPDKPEAAEAQMKVGDIYYQQMEKPDRSFTAPGSLVMLTSLAWPAYASPMLSSVWSPFEYSGYVSATVCSLAIDAG